MPPRQGKKKEIDKADITSIFFYEYYAKMHFKELSGKKKIINTDSKYYISRAKYIKIIDSFNIAIRDLILYESFDFNLPSRMGTIGIRKKKRKSFIDKDGNIINTLPPDWNATLALWEVDDEAKKNKQLVRHLNNHTNGFVAEWWYSVFNATYNGKTIYKFVPCRTAKLMLKDILKDPDNNIDYYTL